MKKLFSVKTGDMLTIAGQHFLVQGVGGTGLSTELILITNRMYTSKEGPTNKLRITWEELINKLIIVHKKIDIKV